MAVRKVSETISDRACAGFEWREEVFYYWLQATVNSNIPLHTINILDAEKLFLTLLQSPSLKK